jgi:carbonic anhydrase
MSRPLVVAAICAVALVGCAGDDGDDAAAPADPLAWNHDPEDGELGPGAWGDIDRSFEACGTGLAQSPIDIAAPVTADLPDLELDYPVAPLVVENTGHTIEVPMPEDGGHRLTIGDDEYRLLQYHLHAPSEHTLDGRSYDAEAHLVHESEEGALAVVAVFLEETEDGPLPLVDSVVGNAPETAGDEVEVVGEQSPLELLFVLDAPSAIVSSYTTYAGSLTTPGCDEGVRWVVMNEPVGISPEALDRLRELIADFPGYDGYKNNNRPTQPLNDRRIERSTG